MNSIRALIKSFWAILLRFSLFPPNSLKSMHIISVHPSLNKTFSTVCSILSLFVLNSISHNETRNEQRPPAPGRSHTYMKYSCQTLPDVHYMLA